MACPEETQKYLIFYMAKYLKILRRYWLLRKLSKIKIKILRPLYLLYLSLQYIRYSPTLPQSQSVSFAWVRHSLVGQLNNICCIVRTSNKCCKQFYIIRCNKNLMDVASKRGKRHNQCTFSVPRFWGNCFRHRKMPPTIPLITVMEKCLLQTVSEHQF